MAIVGVCLSGCGFMDGAEIQESVITILALDKAGVDIVFMAPDINQRRVVNHQTSEEVSETRNVLVESARITRGNVQNIKNINANDLDALIFPGRFGAALNLSDFALKGAGGNVNTHVEELIHDMINLKKPIGIICIAPAMMAKAINTLKQTAKLTIGNDQATAEQIEKLGVSHTECMVQNIVIDSDMRLVSTPAYMLGPRISDVAVGINKLVQEVVKMM